MTRYFCPHCGKDMIAYALRGGPYTREAVCNHCWAVYREPKESPGPPPYPLPKTFQLFKEPRRTEKNDE